MSFHCRRLAGAFCLLSILLLSAGRASATSLITFTDLFPANQGFFELRDEHAAVAVSWTQTIAASNVTIEAWVRSQVGTGPLGEAYLMTAIGLGTTAASEVVAPVSFSAPVIANALDLNAVTPVTLFTGVSLGPGTYYLVLGGPASASTSPFQWMGDSGLATTAAGFSVGAYRLAGGTLNAFEPNNPFSPTELAGVPFFRLTAVDPTVPEPTSLLLIGSGIAAVSRARRRRRRS